MRMWVSESVGKRDFVDFLSDTYAKKPILVSETRTLMNACVRNFTVANDPTSNKFSVAKKFVRAAVDATIKALPPEIVVFDEWYDQDQLGDYDYFVIHKPEDSDALFRITKPEGDISTAQMRVVEEWSQLRSAVPDRLIVLKYDERVRDLFDIVEDGTGGVEIRLTSDAVSTHKFERADTTTEKEELARLYGSSSNRKVPKSALSDQVSRDASED